jgi:hypothetical protein
MQTDRSAVDIAPAISVADGGDTIDRSDASDPVFLLRALQPRHKLLEVSGFKGAS